MKTSDLFQLKKDCCGCELCSQLCPQHIIEMLPDQEGFLYPHIKDEDQCVNCNQCIKCCPLKSKSGKQINLLSNYGGFSKDESDIKKSSSGGFATILGRYFIENRGAVYGVRYSDDCKSALYDKATSVSELERFRTSKYIQPRKGDIFKRVKKDLEANQNVLFVGLPCDIASLKCFLKKDYEGLLLVSLICHGPTSPLVHKQFCDELELHHNSKLSFISVRHKVEGCYPYYIKADFEDGSTHHEQFAKTDYDVAFQFMKRPSCSACPFKLYNNEYGIQSDLIIGDFHFAHPGMVHYNKWGSSQISVITEKGQSIVNRLSPSFNLSPITVGEATHYNIALIEPIPQKINRSSFSNTFAKKSLHSAASLLSVRLIKCFEHVKGTIIYKIALITRPLRLSLKRLIMRNHE